MLKGGQKKLDKNKDGKISGEDFKMMKKANKGGGADMGKSTKNFTKEDLKKLKEFFDRNKGKFGPKGKMEKFKRIGLNKGVKFTEAALGVAVLATKKGQKTAKKMLKGKTQMSPALNYLDRNMGGSAESTKGYGAARTSGMGLQDESLPAGKTLDYYKDIM